MPNTKSAAIDATTEAIHDHIGGFRTETLIPGVEGFVENLPHIADALDEALKKLAEYLESERPVHPDVTEALRELRVPVGAFRDRANEVYDTFKKRHEHDLMRHYESRPGERTANVE